MKYLCLSAIIVSSLASASTIVVDTGHTPSQPGATAASGRNEYYFNLDMSNAVSQQLLNRRDAVYRVSADGKPISLGARSTRFPNSDLFLSIHNDSIPKPYMASGQQRSFAGYSVFVSEKNKNFSKSYRCAQSIAIALQDAGEKPSLFHSMAIKGENRPLLDSKLGIHRYDDLIVLKTAPVPAVLVEIGVIVNPDEEARLSNPGTMNRIASAIAAAADFCTK